MEFNDPKYPRFSITWKWIQDDINHKDAVRDKSLYIYKDLPDGRERASTSQTKMYKELPDESSIRSWAETAFMHYIESKNDEYSKSENKKHLIMKNISDLEIIIKRKQDESWNLTWFSHETFDIGQTDVEVLNSFEQYVSRYEHFCNRHDFEEVTKDPNYECLMGAEDRWRWKGNDDNGNDTKAPCRCSGCKKYGMIRINH